MALFKIGDRIKIKSDVDKDGIFVLPFLTGYTGTIITILSDLEDWECVIELDTPIWYAPDDDLPPNQAFADFCMLEPIVPPKAEDRDLAKVRNLIRTLTHPEPTCPASTIKSTRTV